MPKRYEHNGLSLTLKEWSERSGTPYNLIRERVRRGYPIGIAVGTSFGRIGHNPPDFKPTAPSTANGHGRVPRLHTFNGVTMTNKEWAAHLGITVSTLRCRVKNRGSFAEAVCMPRGTYPGVGDDFAPSLGTGGGSTAQDSAQMDFSGEAP